MRIANYRNQIKLEIVPTDTELTIDFLIDGKHYNFLDIQIDRKLDLNHLLALLLSAKEETIFNYEVKHD